MEMFCDQFVKSVKIINFLHEKQIWRALNSFSESNMLLAVQLGTDILTKLSARGNANKLQPWKQFEAVFSQEQQQNDSGGQGIIISGDCKS